MYFRHSPAGGGRSVGIVRSRTKATEFSLVLVFLDIETYRCRVRDNLFRKAILKLKIVYLLDALCNNKELIITKLFK
jgi:hypothetical protein